MATKMIVDEYLQVVDTIFGLYCDSKRGYAQNVEEFDRLRTENLQRFPNLSSEELDNRKVIYGVGNPNEADSYPLHQCSQAEFRKRNLETGDNAARIGNLCLAQIYQYWEDHYREELAKASDKKKNDLKHDVMGDLRLLRNSIIHHHSVAFSDVANCKVLKWFSPGQKIMLSKKQFEQLVQHIKDAMNELLA